MKKVFLLLLTLFLLVSCSADESESISAIKSADEIMKISTWLVDSSIDGKGQWIYRKQDTSVPHKNDGNGYWKPNQGEAEVASEDVFVKEALEVGVVRTMAPMSLHLWRDNGRSIDYANLNLDIDFDGIVEVEKIEPNDSSIRLWDYLGSTIQAVDGVRVNGPCTVNVCPVGDTEDRGDVLITSDTIADREYNLEIRGYELDGTLVVTAEIKITTLPDPTYPWKEANGKKLGGIVSTDFERTRFCSIELVSYEINNSLLMSGDIAYSN